MNNADLELIKLRYALRQLPRRVQIPVEDAKAVIEAQGGKVKKTGDGYELADLDRKFIPTYLDATTLYTEAHLADIARSIAGQTYGDDFDVLLGAAQLVQDLNQMAYDRVKDEPAKHQEVFDLSSQVLGVRDPKDGPAFPLAGRLDAPETESKQAKKAAPAAENKESKA